MCKVEHAVQAFQQGQSCSQAILSTYAADYGLSKDQSLALASGFSGGMGMAETCGAVTGAFLVLGLARAGQNSAEPQGRAQIKTAVQQFSTAFKERNGTLLCRQLLPCDISTPEGLAKARELGLFRTVCPKFVKDAAEILQSMLPQKP